MRYAPITERLAHMGGAKWEVHLMARSLREQGHGIIELTIGEPDTPAPHDLVAGTVEALRQGRTRYSNGRGEAGLLEALARRYSARAGREVKPTQFLCFPGTQTALYAAMMALVSDGDEVLVGDPMYATYQGVIAATGARAVPVPLRPENGFRISATDIAARITPASRVILLNTPHNPTGAVLNLDDVDAIGTLALEHDLWIVSDEVYEELVFDGTGFTSPFDRAALSNRAIAASSISKSHAAPGFRSGWCAGPEAFIDRLLPVAETMLFGNQPFIADATAKAIATPSPAARDMRERLARRADLLAHRLDGVAGLHVHRPDAGMFALVRIDALGMPARDYALDLLAKTGVAVMPGCSFGETLSGWVRLALTADDAALETACARMAEHARTLRQGTAA